MGYLCFMEEMRMRILLVEPGKVPQPTEIGDSLEAMQAVVSGSIQAVYPFEGPVALVCNEEQIARYTERFRAIELFPEVRHD